MVIINQLLLLYIVANILYRNLMEEHGLVEVDLATVIEGIKNDSLMMSITFEYEYKYHYFCSFFVFISFFSCFPLYFILCNK